MIGILNFNENSKRFYVSYDNNVANDITSGNEITVYYDDLILVSSVEHNGNYYLTRYPKIPLELLVGSKIKVN